MDRRKKERLDLQLLCRVGSGKVLSAPIQPGEVLVTENVSRTGILLRWLPAVPVPRIGAGLIIDVELPHQLGAEPRVMRCSAKVVRIDIGPDSHALVGLTIAKIRFVGISAPPVPRALAGAVAPDLKSMTPATPLLN